MALTDEVGVAGVRSGGGPTEKYWDLEDRAVTADGKSGFLEG